MYDLNRCFIYLAQNEKGWVNINNTNINVNIYEYI